MDLFGVHYYINMLDSNTLNNGGNYWPDILSGDAGVYNKQTYEKENIWHLERNGSKIDSIKMP